MTPTTDDPVLNLVKERAITLDDLSDEQVAQVIKEAVEIGDFHRFVYNDYADHPVVYYIPWRYEKELQKRIQDQQEEIAKLRAKHNDYED